MSDKNPEFYGKKCLGVDFGTKRIGLATYHPGLDPFPLPHSQVENKDGYLQQISQIVEDETIEILIVGLPYLTDGQATDMTERAKNFGENLSKFLKLPLHFQDETLSSFSAEERMKNSPRFNFKIDKSKLDAVAACIILEDFFGVSY